MIEVLKIELVPAVKEVVEVIAAVVVVERIEERGRVGNWVVDTEAAQAVEVDLIMALAVVEVVVNAMRSGKDKTLPVVPFGLVVRAVVCTLQRSLIHVHVWQPSTSHRPVYKRTQK